LWPGIFNASPLRLGRLEQLRDGLFAEVPDDKEPEQASLYQGKRGCRAWLLFSTLLPSSRPLTDS
jgi:hypothetical protein